MQRHDTPHMVLLLLLRWEGPRGAKVRRRPGPRTVAAGLTCVGPECGVCGDQMVQAQRGRVGGFGAVVAIIDGRQAALYAVVHGLAVGRHRPQAVDNAVAILHVGPCTPGLRAGHRGHACVANCALAYGVVPG